MKIVITVKDTDNVIGLKEDIAMRLEGVADIVRIDTADVVPKSEVDKLKIEIEALKIANEKMYAANKEQRAEIDSFLESVDELQADKADVTYFKKQLIANAKSEVAMEIFEEIEKYWIKSDILPDCVRLVDLDKIAEPKKKYTKQSGE